MKKIIIGVLMFLMTIAITVAIPQDLSVHGWGIRDASGNYDGTFNVTARIYYALTGGTSQQTENYPSHTIESGQTDLIIHNISGLNTSQNWFIEIRIDDDTISPRYNVTTTVRSLLSDSVNWSDITNRPSIVTGNIFDQNLNTSQNVSFQNITIGDQLIFGKNLLIEERSTTLSGNLNISGAMRFESTPTNTNNLGFVFCGNNTDGTARCMPHFWVQLGQASSASGVSRSFMIVNEVAELQDSENITSCVAYMDYANETLQIDCNTTTTGADLLVGDDMQIVGDVWIKDQQNEWHFLTRTLTELDQTWNDILFNTINTSLSSGTLTIESRQGDTITYNVNSTENRTTLTSDTVALSSGTNATPNDRYVYYDTTGLIDAATDGGEDTASVAHYLLGNDDNLYALKNRAAHTYEFIKNVYTRFEQEGALYLTNFTPSVGTTSVEFGDGEYILLLDKYTTQSIYNSSIDGFFHVSNDGTYIQNKSLDAIVQYSDGASIGNNKRFNVVFGLVPISGTQSRILAVVQGVPPAGEYTSVTEAEADSEQVTNLFPTKTILKQTFIPIVRVVMQRSGGTNTIQTLNSGQLYIDVRGQTQAAGGSASSPSISDHGQLDGLTDDDHTQYLLRTDEANVTSIQFTGTSTITFNLEQNGASNNLSATFIDRDTNLSGCTDCVTDAMVSNTLTCSDLQAGSEVVADSEVVDTLTIDGGAITLNTNTYTGTLGVANITESISPDSNATTACAGTTTYLDGEGNCDDISSVYESATSNDFDPDRLLGDSTDDNLVDGSIIETSFGTPIYLSLNTPICGNTICSINTSYNGSCWITVGNTSTGEVC